MINVINRADTKTTVSIGASARCKRRAGGAVWNHNSIWTRFCKTPQHERISKKLRIRFSLDNLKLDNDLLNIPLFLIDCTDKLIELALQELGRWAWVLDCYIKNKNKQIRNPLVSGHWLCAQAASTMCDISDVTDLCDSLSCASVGAETCCNTRAGALNWEFICWAHILGGVEPWVIQNQVRKIWKIPRLTRVLKPKIALCATFERF